MDLKEMMVMAKVTLPVLLLMTITPSVSSRPPTISLRSADRVQHPIQSEHEPEVTMHLADGILRDLMLTLGDTNRDAKLSEDEIAMFFREILGYTRYVSFEYGRRFIDIADFNNDHNLDSDGKIIADFGRNERIKMASMKDRKCSKRPSISPKRNDTFDQCRAPFTGRFVGDKYHQIVTPCDPVTSSYRIVHSHIEDL